MLRVERVGETNFNEATGLYEPVAELVWSGRGQIMSKETLEGDAGGQLIAVQHVVVKLPIAGTEAVERGHVVTVVSSDTVPGIEGVTVRLTSGPLGGHLTLRRFHAEEVAGNDRVGHVRDHQAVG